MPRAPRRPTSSITSEPEEQSRITELAVSARENAEAHDTPHLSPPASPSHQPQQSARRSICTAFRYPVRRSTRVAPYACGRRPTNFGRLGFPRGPDRTELGFWINHFQPRYLPLGCCKFLFASCVAEVSAAVPLAMRKTRFRSAQFDQAGVSLQSQEATDVWFKCCTRSEGRRWRCTFRTIPISNAVPLARITKLGGATITPFVPYRGQRLDSQVIIYAVIASKFSAASLID